MARVDVLMPQMGESIAEGTLSKWLKKLGDEVKRDEPLFEISTDKVDAEIPAPSAGVLAEIKVQEGQTVPVQTLVAVIETDKSASTTAAPSAVAQRVPAPAPAAPPVAAAQRAPAAPGGTAVSPPPPTAPYRPLPPRWWGKGTGASRPPRSACAASPRRWFARSLRSIRWTSRPSPEPASRVASRSRTFSGLSSAAYPCRLRHLPVPLPAPRSLPRAPSCIPSSSPGPVTGSSHSRRSARSPRIT